MPKHKKVILEDVRRLAASILGADRLVIRHCEKDGKESNIRIGERSKDGIKFLICMTGDTWEDIYQRLKAGQSLIWESEEFL